MPSGYIFQLVSMERASGPKNRMSSPRLFSCFSSSSSSYKPCRMSRNTLRMPTITMTLSSAISSRKAPEMLVPMMPV